MDNSYIVIQDFMISELGLKGNELIIYACIYGFSQAQGQSFHGSLNYLAKWAGIKDRRNVLPPLNSLVDKGLVTKHEHYINGVKYCEYAAKYDSVVKITTGCCEINNKGVVKNTTGCCENHNEGVVKFTPNILDNNINDILVNNIKDNKSAPVYFADEKLNKAFNDYVLNRKKLKAPMTNRAIELAKNKVMQLANNDVEVAVQILNTSVLNGWKGLFELKGYKGIPKNKSIAERVFNA